MEAKAAVRETSERAPDILWMANRGGVFTHCVGPGLETLTETPDAWIGRAVSEVFPDTPEVAMHLRRALEGETFTILLTLKGTTFKLHYYPAENRKGEIAAAVAVGYDVTRRQPAEDGPLRFQAILERAFGSLADAAVVWDPDSGSLAYCNPAAERLFGFTGQELRESSWQAVLFDDEEHGRFDDEVTGELERKGVHRGEWPMVRKDDRRFWCAWHVSRILDEDGHPLALALIYDVSGPHAAERELELAEERFRALFDRSPFCLLLCRDGAIIGTNPAAVDLFGWQREAAERPRLDEVLVPDDDGSSPEKRLGGREGASRFEVLARRADGSTFPARVSAREVRFPEGPATLVTVTDIEEEKRRLAALEERVRQLEALTAAATDLVAVVDEEGTYLRVSPSCEEVLGFRADQLVGTHLLGNVHPDDEELAIRAFGQLVDDPTESVEAHYRLRHRDGDWLRFEVTFLPHDGSSSPEGILVRHRDVTLRHDALVERDRMSEELRDARHLVHRLREVLEDADDVLDRGSPEA